MGYTYNLLEQKVVQTLVHSRFAQLILLLLTSLGYSLAIFTGLFGSPVGSANFSTIWVWLVWWGVFVILFLPFFGRLWCAVCPIPVAGEYIQRRSFFGGSFGQRIKLSPKFFPSQFQGMWISNSLFFLFAVFAGKLTTDPRLTALTLIVLLLTSVITAVKFRERSFCRHICPIGGSIGVYSLTNPIELRVKSTEICKGHKSKDCVFGNEESFGCPWMVYPGTLQSNQNCGLCMECVRACNLDNISLNLRLLDDDLLKEVPKPEEAVRVMLLLVISVMYPVVFLGTWNSLTMLSNFNSLQGLIGFSLVVAITLSVVSIYFLLPNYLLRKKDENVKNLLATVPMYTLPIGLTNLVGFTLLIMSRNISYIVNTLNDPFGVGWRLIGITPLKYSPLLPQLFIVLSSLLIIAGIYWSTRIVDRISRQYFFDKPDTSLVFRVTNYLLLFGMALFMLTTLYGGGTL